MSDCTSVNDWLLTLLTVTDFEQVILSKREYKFLSLAVDL